MTALIIALCLVPSTALTMAILRRSRRRRHDDIELAAHLIATGHKGRATIVSIDPTGLVVNNINIQCRLGFRIEPVEGGLGFNAEKLALVPQTSMPRIGDVLPCWYDPIDRARFTVGMTTTNAPDQIELYREFGIAHPLDQMRS